MDKRKLAELLVEHKEKALGDHAYTPREILAQAADMVRQKEIHVITGVRRSGKSTLMRLIARYLIREENVPRENILYLNFDDLVKSRQTDLFENLQSTNSGTYKPKNGEF